MRDSKTNSTFSVEEVTAYALDFLEKLGFPALVARAKHLINLAKEDSVLTSCSAIGGAAGIVYIAGILGKEQPPDLPRSEVSFE